jgi:DNA-binding PadR family transcriptional regulator
MEHSSEIAPNLPLTEATYFILLSMAPGPRHGYAIMKDVSSLSKARVSLSTGTLYGALKRLLDQGWISRVDELQFPPSGRIRKAYILTDLGQQLLQAEIQRLETLVTAARLRPAKGVP